MKPTRSMCCSSSGSSSSSSSTTTSPCRLSTGVVSPWLLEATPPSAGRQLAVIIRRDSGHGQQVHMFHQEVTLVPEEVEVLPSETVKDGLSVVGQDMHRISMAAHGQTFSAAGDVAVE
mmetsp:Transcript_123385/g.343668  ORF Transcript_123385/g.343668 Transcript_123385/m.343668 type:complete len:118 (+) Transcript_123385:327-680(+)